MNTLRRVGLVAVSCIILLLCLFCPVSASGFITYDDFIDLGYQVDDDGSLYITGFDPLSFMSTMLATEPNYPDFKPNDIPWKDAPQYIKDILIMDYKDFSNTNFDFSTTEYKVPFVCVRVNGANAIAYVGVNVCVMFTSNNNRLCIGGIFPPYPQIQKASIYRATFRLEDMVMIDPWRDAMYDQSQWDENGKVFTFTGALTTYTGKYDLYFYGANSVFKNSSSGDYLSSIAYPYSDTNMDDYAYITIMQPLGFQSGTFFRSPDDYQNTYAKFFTPSIYPDVNSGIVGDYGSAEDALINGYNPGDISSDIKIDIDTDSWNAVFQIFNMFVTSNSVVVTLIITMLSLGFLALILNR